MEREVVQGLAKVELHCHLDGSVRPEILKEIAELEGKPLPFTDQELRSLMSVPEECASLLEYLTKFDIVLDYLQTKKALEMVAYDLISEVAKEHVIYLEVRFAPTLFTRKGLTVNETIEAVLTGLNQGRDKFGVKSNILLCGMKHHDFPKNEAVVKATKNYSKKGVVGFDLAGDEANNPTENFQAILELATSFDIPLTLHAGECGCPHNIRESIALGAKRIGHGVAMMHDEELIQECVKNKIIIEMCPTSNIHTKAISEHERYPFKRFLDAGVLVTINTDNRTVSNTTLTKEYMQLFNWFGIDYACMKQLNLNALAGAFISQQDRQELSAVIKKSYEEWL